MKDPKRKLLSSILILILLMTSFFTFKNIYAVEGEDNSTEDPVQNETPTKRINLSFSVPTENFSIGSNADFIDSLAVDLYKVAKIGWDGAAATYTFTPESGFENAIKIKGEQVPFYGMVSKIDEDATEEEKRKAETDIETLAVVTDQCVDARPSTASYSTKISTAAKPIKAEVDSNYLYLAVIRKNGDTDYIKKGGDGHYVSFAEINDTDNLCLFKPQLVFALEEDMSIVIKPEVGPCLIIKKDLETYAGKPVTFVFRIDDNNGKPIDYVSLTFSKYGSLETDPISLPSSLLDKEVTVTEVNTGASYIIKAGTSANVKKEIEIESKNLFEFSNEGEDKEVTGYGFQNTYTKMPTDTWVGEKEGDPYEKR